MLRPTVSFASRCLALSHHALKDHGQYPTLVRTSVLQALHTRPNAPSLLLDTHLPPTSSNINPRATALPPWAAAAPVRRFASSGTNIIPFPLAQTGEGISECELIQWFVKEGDVVLEFDKVCEVQSDKATIEITSRYKGSIVKLHHAKGDIVKVGATLVDIEVVGVTATAGAGEGEGAVAGDGHNGQAAPATATPAPTPHAGAGTPTTSPAAAGAAAAAAAQSPAAPDARAQPQAGASASEAVLCSPAVRHLARERGVPLEQVQGTGRDGRVMREDVLRYIEQHQAKAPTLPKEETSPVAPAAAAAAAAGPQVSGLAQPAAGATQVVPLRGFRRAMVKSMTAVASIPHFHYTDEVCVDALLSIRASLASDPWLAGAKLTLLPLAIKALSSALLQHPAVNSSLGPGGSDLLLHRDHNIGVAMAAPGGLVVPNIKQVQNLSVAEIAVELRRLQTLAAANQLPAADVAGGTITISNIGSIGGIHASPLVNPPEVAIVALGRVQKLPRFNDAGQVVARSLLPISWGADHRVVDGAGLAQLSNTWKQLLEEPTRLLLQLR